MAHYNSFVNSPPQNFSMCYPIWSCILPPDSHVPSANISTPFLVLTCLQQMRWSQKYETAYLQNYHNTTIYRVSNTLHSVCTVFLENHLHSLEKGTKLHRLLKSFQNLQTESHGNFSSAWLQLFSNPERMFPGHAVQCMWAVICLLHITGYAGHSASRIIVYRSINYMMRSVWARSLRWGHSVFLCRCQPILTGYIAKSCSETLRF